MFKILFEIVVDPLGLPIDLIYEYLILSVIEIAAYHFAYDKTGELMARGIVSRGTVGKIVHWIIRFLFYIVVWGITRIGIWIYGFVMENKGVSIFSVGCIVAIIETVNIFKIIEENKRLETVRVTFDNENMERKEK